MGGEKSGPHLRGLVKQLEIALANSVCVVTTEAHLLLGVGRRWARAGIVLLALRISVSDSVTNGDPHGSLTSCQSRLF